MLVHEFLACSARAKPEAIAVVQGKRRVSYEYLDRRADEIAVYLFRRGFKKGDRAGVCIDNSLEYLLAYFGILKAGGVVVPFSIQMGWRGIRKIIDDCRPTALFVQENVLQHARDAMCEGCSIADIVVVNPNERERSLSRPQTDFPSTVALRNMIGIEVGVVADWTPGVIREEDLALILYTSGTTGSPKGVMLSHRNLSSNAHSIVQYLNLTPHDKVLVVLPFFYSYGNSLLTTHVLAGGTLVIGENFVYPNLVLEQLVAEEVTGFSGVPTTFAILLHRSNIRRYQFPKVRYMTQAGGAMPPKHALELKQILPGVDIFIMYGQTEASARITFLEPGEIIRKAGSIGKAIPGVEVFIKREDGSEADVGERGELVACGSNIMEGYWNDPEGTARVLKPDGLHTGDMAWRDEESFLYVVGRKSEMIKSGAHRISPREIEEIILEVPGVHEVAVIGEKDEVLGESITAFVVIKEGAYLADKEILYYCKKNLPPFKIPKRILFSDHLPKTNSGKVKKHDLLCR